jgi:Cysteine-rich CPCC
MNEQAEKRQKLEQLSKEVNLGLGSLFKKLTRVTCPCCGYPTLEERGNYDICELCNWEDDGQDDEDSSKALGGPNGGYSLDEARSNFQKYRIMYSPDNNTTITGSDSEDREKLKIELISIFDSMIFGNNISELWKQAQKIEKALEQELRRSIEEYEK